MSSTSSSSGGAVARMTSQPRFLRSRCVSSLLQCLTVLAEVELLNVGGALVATVEQEEEEAVGRRFAHVVGVGLVITLVRRCSGAEVLVRVHGGRSLAHDLLQRHAACVGGR